MNRKLGFATVLLIFLALSFIPVAQAQQQTYMIPLLGARWSIFTITVQVPGKPAWAHDAVVEAMMIWNQAQAWFRARYYPDGRTYNFTESTTGVVRVYFANCTSWCGAYAIPDIVNREITGGTIRINLPPKSILPKLRNMTTTEGAAHELGHILGLGHVDYPNDLMQGSAPTSLPSTLDLYAVHVLAGGTIATVAVLPTSIPYFPIPDSAVPEFPNSFLAFGLLTMLILAILGRKKCKGYLVS